MRTDDSVVLRKMGDGMEDDRTDRVKTGIHTARLDLVFLLCSFGVRIRGFTIENIINV